MSTRLNVLSVEDSESDAALVIRQLEKEHYEVKFERVETPDQMKRALKKQEWDVVLSDHKLPHFSSVAALALLKETGIDIPFIVISGTIGEETAVDLMKAGAHDYIMKDNLKRLFPAIDRELKEAKIRRERRLTEDALQESEKKYRDLVDNALVGVFRTSLQGDILYVNRAMWRMFEFGSAEEMMRERLLNRYKNPIERQRFLEWLQRDGSVNGFETEVLTKTGSAKIIMMSATLGGTLISGMIMDITDRKRAEEQLLFQSSLLDQVRSAAIATELDGEITYWNKFAERLYGWRAEEVLGKQSTDVVVPPAERSRTIDLRKQIDQAGYWEGEFEFQRKDGTIVSVFVTSTLLKDSAGQAIGRIGVSTDITARKRAEEDLRRLLAWQDAIFEGSRDAIFVSDADSRLVSVNQAACLLSGYSREELLRLRIPDLHEAEDLGAYALFHDRIVGGEEILSEAMLRQKGGEKVHAEFNNKRVIIGGVAYMHTTARDITERKRAEQSLQESEQKFRGVIETALEGVWFLDNEFKTTKVNDAVVRMLGYTPGELIGRPFIDFVFDEGRLMQVQEFQRRKRGISGHYEQRLRCKDGSMKWMFLSAKAEMNAQGVFVGTFAMITDITERKKAEEALRESQALFASAFRNSPVAMQITAIEDSKYVDANDVFVKDTGYSRDEIIGRTPAELGLFEDSADREALMEELHAKGSVYNHEIRFRMKSGTVITCLVSMSVITMGGRPHLLASILDISSRKRAEEALLYEQGLLSAIMENLPDHVYFKDKESRFLRISSSQANAFGLDRPEQAVGKTDFDFFAEAHARPAFDAEQEIMKTGIAVVGVEEKESWPDGRETWVSTTKVPLQDTRGETIGTFGISRDITGRKQAEQRLGEERSLLRTIIDAIPDEIVVKDTERKFVLANPAAVKALKRTSTSEIIGFRDEELISESFAREAATEEEAVLSTGRPFFNNVGSSRINPETGEIERSILISKIPLQDESGKVTGLVGINRDVTELKLAEEMLEKERTLLLTLIESIPDEVCLKDLRHRYLVANRSAMKALGVASPGALIGKTDEDFVPQELAREHFAEEEAILQTGESLINRERIKVDPNTGEIERCLLTTKVPVKDQTGKTIGILVVNRYITERRRAEEALRASEEKFRALFEESKDVVYVSTADGRLLDINPAGIELFGYGSKEEHLQIDLSRHSYVDPKDKERFDREMEKDGFVKDFEVVLRGKDGEKLTVLETATAVRDKTGKIVQYRGIIRDVTKQKLLERQFIQAQKMESIGTLAGGIAHDFNNILGIVLGHLALLERMRDNEVQFKESVASINKAVERGASLVRQILTFARKAETQMEPVSINGAVKELARMLQETLPKTIVLELNLDKKIPIVSMDATQLHQALLNLCVNARDAMNGKGHLTIATQLVRRDEIVTRFTKAHANYYVHLSVADTGMGMDDDTMHRIFEPFFTTKEKGKGTGLGLAVVYGVLQAHNGFVDVETVPAIGTTFHLFFPVPDGILEIEQKQTVKPEDLARGTETILVVEDEDVLQDLLSQVLEMQGYKVYRAKDGEEAVRIFGEHKDEIALVLSDMGLPKRNGWDAFKMMKLQDPDIRVILASGYIDPGQTSEVLKSGVKRFIHKPYRINEVLMAVRETLDAKV